MSEKNKTNEGLAAVLREHRRSRSANFGSGIYGYACICGERLPSNSQYATSAHQAEKVAEHFASQALPESSLDALIGQAREFGNPDWTLSIPNVAKAAFRDCVEALSVLAALNAERPKVAPEAPASATAEDLTETRAGLALANKTFQEGMSAGIRACNDSLEGEPFVKPVSPYSAPLLALIKADKETRDHSPCCSSHGVPMTCERYRRTHFVEVRPCCTVDAERLKQEKAARL